MPDEVMDTPTRIPTRLTITIGGFHGPHYEVRLERGRLRVRLEDVMLTVTPSAQEWEAFWAAMEQIGVWRWQHVYDDGQTLDGCQWKIDLRNGEQSVKCFGSNKFPGSDDRETAKPFQSFLAAVSALVQRPFG